MKSLGIEKIPSAGCGDYSSGPTERRFSPYSDNGGSVVAIAGEDYAIIASDTRLSGQGYAILSREQPKLFKLSNQTVLGSTGCWCDILTFCKVASMRMKSYLHDHSKVMNTPAVAQMTSVMLYHKRFFPYYISNILAGLDETGKGCVYSYDPVGHCERNMYRAGGSACTLLQPLLDNQVGLKNMPGEEKVPISMEKAMNIIHDVFISAAEREIHTGDGIFFNIITKDGIKTETVPLRRD
ncbi:proteasome subunit beta type-1 [Eurytemora carolleeae]|uniref:proteasome subunit beta type-1 n=1 Tax=Eurytemora carolleeae TaxID=1294199 RepID=UPI000C77A711|nr:proteasome subunit beta type-1 [Eurytemora carolleeae]|eukprot:XP_023322831.1 proteasome subunit beta type-1-like [Eurytemora affinis]